MSHPSVIFSERGLELDGEYVPLIAGEFHYWRVNPLYWERILDRYVEAGVPIVSTFVCWDAHERELGRFDFSGETDPALDLGRLLDLCAERGLQVLVRVGPIIDAFWPTRGPARDVAALERLEPEYCRRAGEYFDALVPVITVRQASRGGNVLMVCLDNEVYYPYVTTTEADYEPAHGEIEVTYRREFVLARYREWLRERFDSVEQLNEYAGTDFADFDMVGDPDFRGDPEDLTMLAFEHISDRVAENFAWLQDELRCRGIDIPTYCNLRLYNEFIDWHRVDGIIDSAGNQAFNVAFVPEAHEHVIAWSHMLHRARTKFPWTPEHQAGMCFDLGAMDATYGLLPPEHYRYAGQLVTALGERGAALTMFVECDTWHWSPITPLGEVRQRFLPPVSDHLQTLARTRPDRRLADVGLIWCPEDHRSYVSSLHDDWLTLQQQVDTVFDAKEWPSWWVTFTSMRGDDLDFDLVVPAEDPAEVPGVWIYAGSGGVGLKTLEAIAEHVASGGALVVASELPQRALGGGPGASERVRRVVEDLRESKQVTFAAPAALAAALEQLGVTHYSSADAPGCRSYNYEADGERDLWVSNTSEQDREVAVILDRPTAGEIEELTVNSAFDLGSRPARVEGRKLSVFLPGKTVRGFRFRAEGD